MQLGQEHKYIPSVLVLVTEIIKAIVIALAAKISTKEKLGHEVRTFITSPKAAAFAIPAVCYTIHNNLWYVAITELDPVTVAVAMQSKIGFAAFFATMLIDRRLGSLRWLSLGVLICGLILNQVESVSLNNSHPNALQRNFRRGALAMFSLCALSGFAGTMTEILLKDDEFSSSFWVRNIQMSIFSVPLAFAAVVISDGATISVEGPWVGFNWIVCCIILLGSIGGLLTAVALRVADNLLKSVAVALSIALSTILSALTLGTRITPTMCLGILLVVSASLVYSAKSAVEPYLERCGCGLEEATDESSLIVRSVSTELKPVGCVAERWPLREEEKEGLVTD